MRDCISSGDPTGTTTHGSQQLVKLAKQATRDSYLTGLGDFIEMTVATQPAGSCSFLTSARTRDRGKLHPFSACVSSSWFPFSEKGQIQDVFPEEALCSNEGPFSLVCTPSPGQPDAHPEAGPRWDSCFSTMDSDHHQCLRSTVILFRFQKGCISGVLFVVHWQPLSCDLRTFCGLWSWAQCGFPVQVRRRRDLALG